MALLPVDEALRRILSGVTPTSIELVGLLDARNRVLAEDLTATLTQPPFDASAMDGYAVRAADVAAVPTTLAVIGEAQAGCRFDGRLAPGQAVRIFTGAPMPERADAVVIQEDTERSGDRVIVREVAKPGAHVRKAGGDFRAGAVMLNAGHRLDAAAIALAAACGHAQLPVHRQPLVAILATGDELVEPGTVPGPDQIVSSNPYGLAALVAQAGGEPWLLGIATDERADLEAKVRGAAGADVLVTVGGASVGDRDLVKPTLEAMGMTLAFWKVAIRPGKPMLYGRIDKTRVLGLPGNPVSCLVAARVFLVPLLYRLSGRSDPPAGETTAVLAHDVEGNGPRQHYMRAKLDSGTDGLPRVSVLPSQDSSHLNQLAAADALLVRAPHAPLARAGETVRVLPLDF